MIKTNNLIKNTLLAGCIAISFTSCESEKQITEAELPAEISSYISTNFPNNTIVKTEHEKDAIDESYEVTLSDNIQLEFNKNNEVTDIDGTTQLPDAVIPSSIREYVKTNYPNNFITDWESEATQQQVELDNGLELEFDMNGEFLRVDK